MNPRLVRAACACFLVVSIAACGPGELTSEQAQALLDEQLPGGVVEVLGVRQVTEQEAVARVTLSAMEDAEIDVTFALFDTGWRPEGNVEFMGQSFPLAQLLGAVDRGKQRRTMAFMRNIAVANGVMRVDTGSYAQSLVELQDAGYMQEVPTLDAWDNPFVYTTGEDTYTIASLGNDGVAGPAPPATWYEEPYDPDIVLTDGMFTQAPMGR